MLELEERLAQGLPTLAPPYWGLPSLRDMQSVSVHRELRGSGAQTGRTYSKYHGSYSLFTLTGCNSNCAQKPYGWRPGVHKRHWLIGGRVLKT